MFLSEKEVAQLTGRPQGKRQCQWLAKQKIPFIPTATGTPAVSKALIEKILGADSVGNKNINEPDEAALKALMNRKKKK